MGARTRTRRTRRTMGCSPTKDQNHDHKDKDVYLQPDLDIEAYHFHNFVRDLISVDGNVQRFLNTMYMEWPIPNPSVYKNLTRYGQKYETWPQTHNELLYTIDRTENRLIDTILGDKRETWPLTADQVVAAITAGGKYEQKVADGMMTHMFDKNECEACKGETIMWPDFQVIFEHALPDTAKQVKMLEKLEHKPDQHATNLTLKIPESKISDCLCGEYRMYCKNVQQDNSFSYGLIIDSVTETGSEDNGFGTQKRTFTFIGRPRLDGKYKLESGTGTWNEFGSGRFHLEYAEHWPDGMVDNLKARLKCNGKFACDSTSGFIQKARKESTLPDELDKRMASKYYIGDQDAASD